MKLATIEEKKVKNLIKLLFAKTLKKYVMKLVSEAEKRGFTAGVNLPDEKIADFIVKLVMGEDIQGIDKIHATQAAEILKKMVYRDNIKPL